MTATLERLLDRLDELKRPAESPGAAQLKKLLAEVSRRRFRGAAPLILFHEILLFMRAYPQSRALLRQTEKILSSFSRLVEDCGEAVGGDLTAFEEPDVSGIAGTSFAAIFSYDVTRWLARRHPSRVRVEWEGYEERGQLAAALPRFLPLVEEDAYVEPYFDYREWLRAAAGSERRELAWLLERFERLPAGERERAALFDSLRLEVRWQLGDSPATRTHMRRPVREIFYHRGPLLRRGDVSLAREVEDAAPLPVGRLSQAEGRRLLDAGRETMTMRYRELYGYTYGDPRHVLRAEAGRGVEFFVWGVPAERRLPTLAYHAMLICKNGVPCGYAESLTLFERAEVGLNLFYTFREGESAWIYARLLRLLRQALGVKVFSVDPYQLGFENEEGIESGAFWFYRKLGFRPVVPLLAKTVLGEERKIAARLGYRTPERVLRQLASGHVLFEAPSAAHGDWDRFHVRNLGLAVQRRMAARHGGDAEGMRRASAERVADALGVRQARRNERERRAFENLSLLLALVPGLSRWTEREKRDAARIVRAKAGSEEFRYARLLQGHVKLRREIIRLGSSKS